MGQTKISGIRDCDQPATSVKAWLAQMEESVVRVIGVKADRVDNELEITLTTVDDKPLMVDATKFRVEGDRLIADMVLPNVLTANHVTPPRGLNGAKNAAYPVAMEKLNTEQTLAAQTKLRQVKYLNNRVERDHRNIKRIVKPMRGFKSIHSARQTLSGIEAMSLIRKGPEQGIARGDVRAQVGFVSQFFGLVA